LKTEISQKVLSVPSSTVTEQPSRQRTSTIFARLSLSLGASSLLIAPLCDQAFATKATSSISNPLTSAPTSQNSEDDSIQQLRQDASATRGHDGTDAGLVGPQVIAQRTTTQWPTAQPRYTSSGNNGVVITVPAPRTNVMPSSLPSQSQARPRVATGSFNTPTDRATDLVWPARGSLSSRYGRRWGRMHQGIDIAGPTGTPILAAAEGTVVASGFSSGGYGNVVDIQHADGSLTRYGHNSRLLVSVGQQVKQGQNIAEMGSTGRSTGPHLHFEFHTGSGSAVNPMAYLPSSSS
jgi:murein DD-endopeptidase MepM/ murein hydrolase activator NlpD